LLDSLGAIAFAGTPAFAVPTLAALVRDGARVSAVLTQPDRPRGRGRRVQASPVKLAAVAAGLTVVQPRRLDDPTLLDRLGPRPEYLVVVAYGLLLPAWMLAWPRRAALNVHASLLPRWRGAAPIQRAILAGDTETGVSIMRMDAGLDTGPVYTTAAVPIGPHTDAAELHDTLAALGAETLASALPRIDAGALVAQAQPDTGVTQAAKLKKSECLIDWHRSATELDRQIRAFVGWPVAEARLSDDRRLRVWAARVVPAGALRSAPEARPGDVLATGADGIDVATGDGVLRLVRVQPPSGRIVEARAYLSAHSLDRVRFV
jgi:methionyl-tRNA formyltransferase